MRATESAVLFALFLIGCIADPPAIENTSNANRIISLGNLRTIALAVDASGFIGKSNVASELPELSSWRMRIHDDLKATELAKYYPTEDLHLLYQSPARNFDSPHQTSIFLVHFSDQEMLQLCPERANNLRGEGKWLVVDFSTTRIALDATLQQTGEAEVNSTLAKIALLDPDAFFADLDGNAWSSREAALPPGHN